MNLSINRRLVLAIGSAIVSFIIAFVVFGKNSPSNKKSDLQTTFAPATINPDILLPGWIPEEATYTSKILFMGDAMLARSVGQKIKQGSDPFINAKSVMAKHDARVINIETTIADPSMAVQASGKLYTFNAPLESIQSLKSANIDLSVLANNHTSDYGSKATEDMLNKFDKADLATVGAGKTVDQAFAPTIIEVPAKASGQPDKLIRVAVIGVNDIENSYTKVASNRAGSAYFDKSKIKAAIKRAKNTDKANVVVVFPHWGIEYDRQASARQKEWGHFFIDSGADIVVGGHAHVIQPTEKYKGKYIVYSMGNFIFDGMSGNALKGQMISLDINLSMPSGQLKISKPKSIPTLIDSSGFPRLN